MIKLLIGGSPCTFWSIAQKNGRETEAKGLGWELFKNYLVAKEKFKPDFFLYENNKSAAQAIKNQIKQELNVYDGTLLMEDSGARYIEINSALVSAQNRQRFYVHNCGEVEQPKDRGILLKDILETTVAEPINATKDGKAIALKAQYQKDNVSNFVVHQDAYGYKSTGVAEPIRIPPYGVPDKSRPIEALYANHAGTGEGSLEKRLFSDNPNKQQNDLIAELIRVGGGMGGKTGLYAVPFRGMNDDTKCRTLTANYWKTSVRDAVVDCAGGRTVVVETALSDREIDYMFRKEGRTDYGYIQNTNNDKAKCITANIHKGVPYNVLFEQTENGLLIHKYDGTTVQVYEVKDGLITIKGKQYPIKLADGYYIIRKLTVTECERLQTMPDGYTSKSGVSASQCYKGLGNGWTAEVVKYILNNALKDIPKDEEIVVLSMYDGIGTGRYILDSLGFTNVKYFSYEIDRYAMQIAKYNYPDIKEMGDAFAVNHPDWTIGY